MAMTTHYETYSSYTSDELDTEIAALKARRLGYLSQSAGGKSYTQDMNRLDEMLQAATRVKRERSGGVGRGNSMAVADFSGSAYRG